jgi:hypothetical protein
MGPAVIPQVRDLIYKSSWSTVKYPNEIRYVAGLVSLIHDLDESESKQIRAKLVSDGCDPALRRILDSIGSFKAEDYLNYEVRGIKIFEHNQLLTKQNVKRRLERWLKSIPDQDLAAIERIYIIRKEDLASLGSYAPILYCINLAWDNPSARWNPISWVNNFQIEGTLYHEIGHHVHRHTFGQDPEQEEAADEYADRIMAQRSSHLLDLIKPWSLGRDSVFLKESFPFGLLIARAAAEGGILDKPFENFDLEANSDGTNDESRFCRFGAFRAGSL